MVPDGKHPFRVDVDDHRQQEPEHPRTWTTLFGDEGRRFAQAKKCICRVAFQPRFVHNHCFLSIFFELVQKVHPLLVSARLNLWYRLSTLRLWHLENLFRNEAEENLGMWIILQSREKEVADQRDGIWQNSVPHSVMSNSFKSRAPMDLGLVVGFGLCIPTEAVNHQTWYGTFNPKIWILILRYIWFRHASKNIPYFHQTAGTAARFFFLKNWMNGLLPSASHVLSIFENFSPFPLFVTRSSCMGIKSKLYSFYLIPSEEDLIPKFRHLFNKRLIWFETATLCILFDRVKRET